MLRQRTGFRYVSGAIRAVARPEDAGGNEAEESIADIRGQRTSSVRADAQVFGLFLDGPGISFGQQRPVVDRVGTGEPPANPAAAFISAMTHSGNPPGAPLTPGCAQAAGTKSNIAVRDSATRYSNLLIIYSSGFPASGRRPRPFRHGYGT
ncbi:MAG: hypothetical protein M3N18_01015 [Actinomycetota bacterium]|nr:hypothetical protein [Actinomycetota bacterium]